MLSKVVCLVFQNEDSDTLNQIYVHHLPIVHLPLTLYNLCQHSFHIYLQKLSVLHETSILSPLEFLLTVYEQSNKRFSDQETSVELLYIFLSYLVCSDLTRKLN